MTTLINTFTALVDALKDRSRRADRQADIISYARLTMREMQVMGLFKKDLIEDQITATADPFVWEWPARMRKMVTVSYPQVWVNGQPIYPHFLDGPGRQQREHDFYYYPTGDAFVFVGCGASTGMTAPINVAYLSYFRPLKYYTAAETQPATYDLETETWSYATAVTATEQAAARELVTNWLLTNWFEVIAEGTLAKLYKLVDDPRASSTYAFYKQAQTTFKDGEAMLAVAGL